MSEGEHKIKKLLKEFAQRPVAYQKIYAQITGSAIAGLLLSQLVYWWYGPAEEKEFYKTNAELIDELALGASELKNAKSTLKKLKIIITTRKGVPCRTFYKLDESVLLAHIFSWAKIVRLTTPTEIPQRLQQRTS